MPTLIGEGPKLAGVGCVQWVARYRAIQGRGPAQLLKRHSSPRVGSARRKSFLVARAAEDTTALPPTVQGPHAEPSPGLVSSGRARFGAGGRVTTGWPAEWACFAAQQAAEKAVKALHLHEGQEAWGHVIAKLLDELPETVPISEELVDRARVLDNFYIPARYPNSHPEGPPFEHFGSLQSKTALDHACAILEFVRNEMA